MPGIYAICYAATEKRAFTAWRWAYIFPGLCHTFVGLAVMFLGQDLPDGNYKVLTTSGALEEILRQGQLDRHEKLPHVGHGRHLRILLRRRTHHE